MPEPAPDRPNPPTLRALGTSPEETAAFWPGARQEFHLPPGAEEVRIDDYELLGEVARGGMGIVYRARQISLNRIVALKMARAGSLATPQELQRFQGEAEAAAKLDHPGIVPIYEVGTSAGRPFFSMAFMEGQSLAAAIARNPLPPRRAAELIRQAAEALVYAHGHGIIHRDLKPANILVDPAGQPRVTDFGLAKRADSDSDLTQAGQVMGTPSFMPPEQAAGDSALIGPRSDVYSLGATLYALVTGRPPFQAATALETMKQVAGQEPVPPRRLNPAVGRDLETICLKCLAKRPERRYQSARELADDLGRFLDGRTILARRAGGLERLVRLCQRNPFAAGSLAVVVGVFLAAFVLVSASYWRAETALINEAAERKRAETARDAARWQSYRASLAAAVSSFQLNNGAAAVAALDAAPEEYRHWEWHHLRNRLVEARFIVRTADGGYPVSNSAAGLIVTGSGQTEIRLWNAANGSEMAILRGHQVPILPFGLALSSDGAKLVSLAADNTIRLWDTRTGAALAVHSAPLVRENVRDNSALFSPDGSHFVTTEGPNRSFVLRDGGTGQVVATVPRTKPPRERVAWAFSPKGAILACNPDETIRLLDVRTGAVVATLRGHTAEPERILFSPGGERLCSYFCQDSTLRIWDVATGKELNLIRQKNPIVRAAFSPDGSRLAAGGAYPDNAVTLWEVATGRLIAEMTDHKNGVNMVAFSPDGRRLASGSLDQTARLWDAATGRLIAVLSGHTGAVAGVVFTPDGTRLATYGADPTSRIWDGVTGDFVTALSGHTAAVAWATFDPSCSRFLTLSSDGTARVWDMALAEQNGIYRGHTKFVYDVAFTPDGTGVVSAAWDGTVRFWDATSGRQTRLLKQSHDIVASFALSHDGRRVAAVTDDDTVRLWDVADGQPLRAFPVPTAYWLAKPRAAFSPDGTLLATGQARPDEALVHLWDVAGGQLVHTFAGHEANLVADVAFSPDGSRLASGGEDATVRIWDVAAKTPVAVLRGHKNVVFRVAYSADGRLLGSASSDRSVRLWDAAALTELAVLDHGCTVYGLAFSPDGTRLATGCSDNTIRLWDVARREQVAELRGHEAYVHAVAFSPDGTRLVSGSGDNTVRVWDSLSESKRARRAAVVGGR